MTLVNGVSAWLEARAVPHALIGAAALAAAGVARSTYDLDLLTTDARVLDSSFWTGFIADVVDIRSGDADDPLRGVVRIEAYGERPVDLIIGRHAWQTRAVARARHTPGEIPIVSKPDLVLLKLYAGGTQDLWDVRELLALPDADRLVADVDADVHVLPDPARELWRGVRR